MDKMKIKEFFEPNKWKIIITILIPFLFGRFLLFINNQITDVSRYKYYFPYPLVKSSCGMMAFEAPCRIGFDSINLIIDILFIIILYFVASLIN